MIIPDSSAIFPECPTYGFTVEPRYLVKIVTRESGHERRDRKWARPLNAYVAVPMGERVQRDVENVVRFWHAMGGRSTTFRFKDWSDYSSAELDEVTTPLDQPMVQITGSPGGYQLFKQYADDWLTYVQQRPIYKPVGSTIRVANHLGVEQASSAWNLEEGTGLLTPLGGFSGVPTTWGGEFYVPVRFDSELSVEMTNYKIMRATFAMIEQRVVN